MTHQILHKRTTKMAEPKTDPKQPEQQKQQDIKFKANAIRIAIKEAHREVFTPSIPIAPSSLNAEETYKILTHKAQDKYNALAGAGKMPPVSLDNLKDEVVVEFESFFDIKELSTDRKMKLNSIVEQYNNYYYKFIEPNKEYKRIGAGVITVSRAMEMIANLNPEKDLPNPRKKGITNFRMTKIKDVSEDVLDMFLEHLKVA